MVWKTTNQLDAEWHRLKKDWYQIYQWESLNRKSYSEYVAGIILKYFSSISLSIKNLRQNGFKIKDHCGQAQLSTPIFQHTEKRFCRALYNYAKEKYLEPLGFVIDYEVPLKEKKDAEHGDIDLISQNNNDLLIIEAKQYNSTESILKAILEAFVYTKLLSSVKTRFYSNYGLNDKVSLIPAILTFKSATSGQQLISIKNYPNIKQLLGLLNEELKKDGLNNFRFFIVANEKNDLKTSLETRHFDGKGELIIFRKGFIPDLKEIKI